jgi:hypothetical protein
VALVESAAEIDQAVISLLVEYNATVGTIASLTKNMNMLKHDEKIKLLSIKIEEQCLEKRSYFARMQFEAVAAKAREAEKANAKGWAGTGIGMGQGNHSAGAGAGGGGGMHAKPARPKTARF